MGHSRTQKAENHARILDIAARRFRERGFDGVGLAALMEEAGLTLGGFYKHFASRDAMLIEATARAFENVDRRLAAELPDASHSRFTAFLDAYLVAAHRDDPGDGCAVATLATDVARHPAARPALTAHFRSIADRVANLLSLSGEDARARGAAVMCAMAGAVAVARALDDEKLSDAIFEAMRRLILSAEPTGARKPAVKVKKARASKHRRSSSRGSVHG